MKEIALNILCGFYNCLANQKGEKFWEVHSEGREAGFYSEEFKDGHNILN